MSREDEDREQAYDNFEKEVMDQINPPKTSGKSDSEDAPYGVCFQNQMYNCGPACVAFIPYDEGPDGQPLSWGERCEILVAKRVQAKALVNIDRHLTRLIASKPAAPAASDGPAPPPKPGVG